MLFNKLFVVCCVMLCLSFIEKGDATVLRRPYHYRVRQMINELRRDFHNMEERMEATSIAFQACATRKQSVNRRTRLMFDYVPLNEGEFYNPRTSVFTCPYTGLYEFKVTLLSEANRFVVASIMTKGIGTRGEVWIAKSSGRHVQSSNSIIVRCAENGQVWVQGLRNIRHAYLYADRHKNRCLSTFSGRLIYIG